MLCSIFKTLNFAVDKTKKSLMNSLRNKAIFAAQKNFSSACFFMPFYLVNPNNCVTHTHTHTHTHILTSAPTRA